MLLAQLIALLANVHRDTKKRPVPFSPNEILPPIPPRADAATTAPQPEAPQLSAAQAFNAAIMAS